MSIRLKIFQYLSRWHRRNELRFIDIELSFFEKSADAKLLDCGCGDGEFSLKIAERIGTKNVFGIDIIEENVIKAKAKGIDVWRGDLNDKLPFEDETLDVVLAHHVIEHLYDTDTFIKEIHRVLKKGGYVVIASPNLAAFHNILFLIVGVQPPTLDISDETLVGTWNESGKCVPRGGPGHRRMFTLGAFTTLLKHYGFKVERDAGLGFFLFPFQLARVICVIDKRHASDIIIKAKKI